MRGLPYFPPLRLLFPSAACPQGVDGFFLPTDVLPSPPPWGWSTGFVAEPLTLGRLPNQRLDPAFPKPSLPISMFPTRPTLARQFWDIKRISLEGSLSVANWPSFAITFAAAPAALTDYPPLPDFNSILCIMVPRGILVEVDPPLLLPLLKGKEMTGEDPSPNCTSFSRSIQLSGYESWD